jgi:polar amino acid transport system substrate-binding protein
MLGHSKSFAQGESAITLAFTFSMPPYLSQDLKSGIELDIIKAALEATNQKNIEVHNVHYLRAIELAKEGKIDLIAGNLSNQLYSEKIPDIYTSTTTIHYVDCAISLRSKNINLKEIDNYYDKRIWAFKSASLVFGSEFQNMANTNPHYSEDFDQQKQIDMLSMGRIDVAISDRNIFSSKLLEKQGIEESHFKFDTIGPPTARSVRSTNNTLIAQINKGLGIIKQNGRYQAILGQYKDSYSQDCL